MVDGAPRGTRLKNEVNAMPPTHSGGHYRQQTRTDQSLRRQWWEIANPLGHTGVQDSHFYCLIWIVGINRAAPRYELPITQTCFMRFAFLLDPLDNSISINRVYVEACLKRVEWLLFEMKTGS